MKKLKCIVLILLTIIFIMYGMGFMMYRGINNTLLDQQYYRSVLDEFELSAIAHGELVTMIAPIVEEGLTGGSPVTDPKKKAAVDAQVTLISTAITSSLHEAWIEEQALMITDGVVDLFNGNSDSLSLAIELKAKLDEIEQNIAAGLEKLTDAELFAMFGAPRAYIPVIAEQIVGSLGLPESLELADLDQETLELATGYYGKAKTIFGILAWVVIILFLVLCILFWKVGRGLQWFGVSTVLTGAFFLGLISFFSNLSTIEKLAGTNLESIPLDSSIIQDIISFTFSEMKLMPILFLVGGVVLFFLGVVLHRALNKAD